MPSISAAILTFIGIVLALFVYGTDYEKPRMKFYQALLAGQVIVWSGVAAGVWVLGSGYGL